MEGAVRRKKITDWEILDAMPVGQTLSIDGSDKYTFGRAIMQHHRSWGGGVFKKKKRTWFFHEIIDITREA